MRTWPRRAVLAGMTMLLASAGVGTAAAASSSTAPVTYYVVSDGYQGQPEFLYEIAQRFLGNGNLESEIFNLNKGHEEPDGKIVANPAVIEPGWYLEMPSGAKGQGLITGQIPTYAGPETGTEATYYVVTNGYDGKPEFLSEIAQRFLGKSNLESEIFNLNNGRKEPGGQTFSNAAVIEPGWYLVLPASATGQGLITALLPAFVGHLGETSASAKATSVPAIAASPAKSGGGSTLWMLIAGIVVAVLLLAAGTWWAVRRLGSREPKSPTTVRDESAAWTIDRVLRTLATACAQQERTVPGIGAVIVDADTVWLRLTGPDEQPAPGWTAAQQGRTWSAPLRSLQNAPVDDALPAPCPRLVSVGDSGSGRFLLNLDASDGLIALDGDARLGRALAEDWVEELATSPWSHGTTVLRIGFTEQPVAGSDGVKSAASLGEAAELLEEADGGVLVLGRAPSGREAERLGALAQDPEGRWTVLVLGNPKSASWRMAVDAAGLLQTGLLREPIRVHTRARRLEPA